MFLRTSQWRAARNQSIPSLPPIYLYGRYRSSTQNGRLSEQQQQVWTSYSVWFCFWLRSRAVLEVITLVVLPLQFLTLYNLCCKVAGTTVGKRSSTFTSPFHRWSFNGDVVDYVGGLEGSLSGNVSYSDDAVEGSQSLQLGCCDASIAFEDYSLKEALTYYTVSLWFKEEKRTGVRRYLYEEGGALTGFALRLNGNSLEAAVVENGMGPGSEQVASCGPVEIGKWHHGAAVYSNGTLICSLDGKSTASVETGYGELAQHFHGAAIGGGGLSDFSSAVRFVGLIDDFRIFDGLALTGDQLGDLVYASNKTNFVIIIADDLNGDSPGFMGGGVAPDVTPNLDRLANESLVFELSHSATSVCQSSRQSMLSGKYPPNYGNVGFFPMEDGTETVVSSLKNSGYLTATFHKFWHMRPFSSFPWDMTEQNTYLENREYQENGKMKKIGRSPNMLAKGLEQTVSVAKSTDKPFFAIVNSADPHRPFYGSALDGNKHKTEHTEIPSRVFTPDEVTVPHPLPDIPEVREDVAQYASSVRRLDDTVGACLDVLEREGIADNTVVIFVSDNGMPMPYGKFETYRDSLRGPMIVRWPSHITPAVDSTTLVSLTDLAPTILDIADAQPLSDIDGRSLLPIIRAENIEWRKVVVGSRYEDIYYGNGLDATPDPEALRAELRSQGWVDATDHHIEGTMKRVMNKRGVSDGVYHYIYNHFYNDDNKILAYPYGSETLWAMQSAALTNATIAKRLEFYSYRAQEECYNVVTDPGFENNLVEDPDSNEPVSFLRNELLSWMHETNDPVVDDFEQYLAGH